MSTAMTSLSLANALIIKNLITILKDEGVLSSASITEMTLRTLKDCAEFQKGDPPDLRTMELIRDILGAYKSPAESDPQGCC